MTDLRPLALKEGYDLPIYRDFNRFIASVGREEALE